MSNEDKDFMGSYDDNDEITAFVLETLKDPQGEKYSVYVEYHYYSDGKHLLVINDHKVQVNAWTLREDLKDEISSGVWA